MIILKKKKSTYDKQTIYEIIDLYVIEDYRHKNIGKSLIAFAKNKFNCRLELSCFYDAPANKFYKHLGAKLLECVYTIWNRLKKVKFQQFLCFLTIITNKKIIVLIHQIS